MKLALAIQTDECIPPVAAVGLLSGSFEEKLVKAAQWGADGVELLSAFPERLDPVAMRDMLRANHLQAAVVSSGAVTFVTGLTLLHADPVRAREAPARLHALIDFAAAVGAPLVSIGSFRGKLQYDPGGRAHLVHILQEAADYSAARGVRLVIEPLNRFETDLIVNADEGLAFLEEVRRASVGLMLDTFHVNIEESSWIEPFRRVAAAGKLWHVHISDNNRLAPGSGLIDFRPILATLKQVGYAGFLSAEILARPDPDTAAIKTLTTMRPLLDEQSAG